LVKEAHFPKVLSPSKRSHFSERKKWSKGCRHGYLCQRIFFFVKYEPFFSMKESWKNAALSPREKYCVCLTEKLQETECISPTSLPISFVPLNTFSSLKKGLKKKSIPAVKHVLTSWQRLDSV